MRLATDTSQRNTDEKPPGKFLRTLTATAILASIGMPAYTQSVFIEEVIVTAQKKAQNLQDVGISVTSFSGAQIEALNWDNSTDIGSQTPSLHVTSNAGDAANVSLFSIRGVSQTDFAEGQEAPVALYRDEVYIASPGTSGVPIYDLERVEVLRGPQGTLYGRNATGGLVHFISKRPTDEFEGDITFKLEEYGTLGMQGAISGPLSDNTQGRLAVYYNKSDGYLQNSFGPNGRADDTISLRGQLNFDINDSTSLLLLGQHTDIDTTGTAFHTRATKVNANGDSVYCKRGDANCGVFNPNQAADSLTGSVGDLFVNGVFDVANGSIDDGDGSVYKGAYDLPNSGIDRTTSNITAIFKSEFGNGIEVTSVSDYNVADKEYIEDTDSIAGQIFEYETNADIEQYTQEIRFNHDGETLDWIFGGYYLNNNNVYEGSFPFTGFGYEDARFRVDQTTETMSGFGQIDFDLSDTLLLTAGARWTQDKIDFNYQFITCEVTSPSALGFCPARLITDPVYANDPFSDNANFDGFLVDGIARDFSRKDTEYSGKVQLDWQASPDHLFYAGISRGTKGGGFNSTLDGFAEATEDAVGFDPEILMSYETGFKSRLADGAVRLNASAFYYDYDNYQAFFFAGTTGLLVNTQAEFYGAEAELTITPGGGWDILAGVSLLDTTVNGNAGGTAIVDQQAPLAPEITVNALVRKTWDLEGGSVLSAQVSGNYIGRNYFSIVNSEATRAGDYALFDASVTLTSSDDKWEFSLYSTNLTDETPLNFGFDLSAFVFATIQTYGAPRISGARIKANF
jgi:iron complex outermembrane receptor protein